MAIKPKPRIPELMGAREACEALGVKSANLGKVRDLPKPVQVLAATTVWRATDIRALARKREREAAKREASRNVK
jgi:hypothetical protein